MTNSVTRLLALIRDCLCDIYLDRGGPLLLIDEAHLMRLEVFAEPHTLDLRDFDSRPLLPMILSGQTSLVDKLLFHTSRPFSSRIVGRTHLKALQRGHHTAAYLAHHLKIAGGKEEFFSEEAVTAVHQSSGGWLRRAGALARGALLAAAREKCPRASAEHVRVASTEIL